MFGNLIDKKIYMAYNDFIEDEISDINGITVAVQTYTACQAAAAWKQFFDEQLRGGRTPLSARQSAYVRTIRYSRVPRKAWRKPFP